jgi:small ligand-binding sensory domain FIST
MPPRSFVAAPEGLERALAATRAQISRPAGGVVFVAGALVQAAPRVAEIVRQTWRGIPSVVVPAAGVASERGEIEGAAAATGLLWTGGEAIAFGAEDEAGLGGAIAEASGGGGTAILFAANLSPDGIARAAEENPKVTLFGAGAVSGSPIVSDGTHARRVAGAGIAIRRLAPLVRFSPACRLLSELAPIEEAERGWVLRVGGMPALERLSACATGSTVKSGVEAPRPVVFAALAEGDGDDRYLIRPVRGVDPDRKGVLIGPEARPGVRLGFAVRDATAARTGIEAMAREVARDATGSAPSFALLLTCAGRGQGLYGAPDVETRILRQRLVDVPIAGMHSAFEIVPWGAGAARVALYTAVLALFRAPS